MSAAEKLHPEEHAEAPAAANQPFLQRGGLFDIMKSVGGLAKGVVYEAPRNTLFSPKKKEEAANNHAHHKEEEHPKEEAHKKDHPEKADEKKEGHAEEKKEEKAEHGGHGHDKKRSGFLNKVLDQEWGGDAFVVLKSLYNIYEDAKDGKMDKHAYEHAVDAALDAVNWGWARPLAGIGGNLIMGAVAKYLKLREHALAPIEPKYETLGTQILNLPKDKKHGYHAAVEGLCHSMTPGELEEKFDCFTSREAFEGALKTEPGREEIKAQYARIMGSTKNPNPINGKKRIDRIFDVLGAHIHEDTHTEKDEHGHTHSKTERTIKHHKQEDEKAEAALEPMTQILFNMREWVDNDTIKTLYHGEKAKELDYDNFGDKASEFAGASDENRIIFMTSFKEHAFKAKFKGLIEPARLQAKVKSEEGCKELRGLMKALFDLEEEAKLNPKVGNEKSDLEVEIEELLGTATSDLKTENNYAKGTVARENYIKLKAFIDTIKTNLEGEASTGTSYLEMIYEGKLEVTYDKFGFQLKKLKPEQATAYLRKYESGDFADTFRWISSPASLKKAVADKEKRIQAQAELLNFLGLPPGPVETVHISRAVNAWKLKITAGMAPELGAKFAEWKKDIEAVVQTVTAGEILNEMFIGPKKSFIAEVGENIAAVIKNFNLWNFQTAYQNLLSGTDMSTATPKEKEAVKAQLVHFFGMRPANPQQTLNTLIEKFGEFRNTEDIVKVLNQMKGTLTPENVTEIYKEGV